MNNYFIPAAMLSLLGPNICTAQQKESRSDMRICNESSAASIQVAYVELIPMRALIGVPYPWEGAGWVNVKPNSCKTVFEEAHQDSSFWLRIESDKQVLVAEGNNDMVHAVNVTFCYNPSGKYSWRQANRTDASTNCKNGTHPGVFNFYLAFNKPTHYTLRINPDRLGRMPVEKFGLTPSENQMKQSIIDFIPTDIAGSARWPKFRETIQRANSSQNRPRILSCTYFNKKYSFWHVAPPDNLHEFVKIDMQSGGGLSGIGIEGMQNCPPTEAEAAHVESKNKEKWRRATLDVAR
ncbi:DUF1036 domain-containing protein [Variovorax sp. J22R133]|uniref:DUF1036 domain-containing protein n=1 Tax=Variovorax brevis TaxID=3053503 RepID=UPI002576C394|nr:DUF1036 domain-containing protein [Variovorax sp. J22R133]MDM0117998.1 DUF1036 domain-containing protein [Variovorax sp. J22R133]